jgi:hypothetical protein
MSNEFINQASHLQTAIKLALINQWDPIGVKDIPEASNEYDGYVPTIYNMLIQKKTKKDLFDYLWQVETEHMSLIGNREATTAFAGHLLSLADKE